MKLKCLLFAMLSLFTMAVCGCGSDADGLNGAIVVDAEAVGSRISATASYTHPTESNLIGTPITMSVQIGSDPEIALNGGRPLLTNNSGSVTAVFTPPAFTGTQTITVIARTGSLVNFDTITMTGSSLTVTSPPALTLSSALPTGTALTVTIPPAGTFVTITDPFTNNLNGHQITIAASAVSNNPGSSVTQPAPTTTTAAGTAPFPGTSATLIVPAAGAPEVMTITWTVTDTVTGLTGTGLTTITLTKI